MSNAGVADLRWQVRERNLASGPAPLEVVEFELSLSSQDIAESGFDKLKTRIRRVCTLDVPVPFSPPLEEYIGPRDDRIVDAIRAAVA